MADAYKLKADTSLPRAIREVETLAGGETVYETEGHNYAKGDYVLAENIAPFVREKADSGDLDHLLEPVSRKEAEEGMAESNFGTYIPEHEAERVVLEDAGHTVVPRSQVLELMSEGADDAKSALESAKDSGADERPNLTAAERPSLAEVSRGDAENVADEDSVEVDSSLQLPTGQNVGETKAAAEGSAPKRGRKPAAAKPAAAPAPAGESK